MIRCKICWKEFKSITNTHLKKHNLTMKEYIKEYGECFSTQTLLFFKNRIPWNKGKTGLQVGWNKNTCNVNHDFFNYESNNMYYILGMWFADGCIVKNRTSKVISLSLHKRDFSLLKRIAEEMGFKKRIYPSEEQYLIDIYSESMYNYLNNKGCTRRKSLTVEFPFVPPKYTRHFIRGYFDGNGCISKSKKRGSFYVSITCGSLKFLESTNYNIKKYTGIEFNKPYHKKDSNCYCLRTSAKAKVSTFLNWIYNNSELKMDRKYQRFLEFKANV